MFTVRSVSDLPCEFIIMESCHVKRHNSQFSILSFHTDSSSRCSRSLLASHWVITMATDVRKTYRILTTKSDQMHFILYKIIWEEPVTKLPNKYPYLLPYCLFLHVLRWSWWFIRAHQGCSEPIQFEFNVYSIF